MDLGRGRSAAALAAQLDDFLRGSLTSGAFAVVGAWGAGKTTLLHDALARIRPSESESLSIVEFTPWMYANEDAIFEGFALLLLQETLRRGKARKRVAAGLRVLSSPLQTLPMDFSATAQTLAAAVDVAYTPEQIRRTLAKALLKQNRRVLLVVDDLDRLDPAELLTMFKLLRLVSDIPGFGYVLAFDEDTLLHLLQQTSIAHGSPERARRYLEKLIERRTEVHPLTVGQMLALLEPTLNAMPSRDEEEDGLGSFRLDVLFESRLTTPRAIERFAQALDDVPTSLAGEVFHWDLCSCVFLRMFFPDVWALIVRERRTMTADHRGFADYFGDGAKIRATTVQARLAQLYAPEPDGGDLKQLIEHLFPALTSLAGGRETSPGDRRGQRIGNPDYVDRYLWLDLPPGSISDAKIRAKLSALSSVEDAQSIVELIAAKPATGMTVLERALRAGVTDRPTLFRVLDEAFRISHQAERPMGTDLEHAAAAMARQLLLECEPAEFQTILSAHGRVTEWPLLRHIFVRDQQITELPPQVPVGPLLQQARADLVQQLIDDLRQAPSPSMDQEAVRQKWFDLRRLSGPAEALAEERFIAMKWNAIDIATLGLSVVHDSGGRFVALDIGHLRSLIGTELVDLLQRSTLPSYPDAIATADRWRLQDETVQSTLAGQIAAFVLATGRSFGGDPFAIG